MTVEMQDAAEIRRNGDVAVVGDVQTNHASYDDQEVRLQVRVSQIWVQSPVGRRLVSIQFSPLG